MSCPDTHRIVKLMAAADATGEDRLAFGRREGGQIGGHGQRGSEVGPQQLEPGELRLETQRDGQELREVQGRDRAQALAAGEDLEHAVAVLALGVTGAVWGKSELDRRAATIGTRRSVKKDWQAAWLLKAVSLIDLTTLAGDDTIVWLEHQSTEPVTITLKVE